MKRDKRIFLRNDDVRESLDKELIDLTEICIKHEMPISHAVEPANVTKEVADWLIAVKRSHPELIEIIQHGYDHNRNNPHVKQEFGGGRDFTDQMMAIKKGKDLMDKWFGSLWSPVFTFPYGTYNQATLDAVNTAGYKAISGKITYSTKNRIKNAAGRLLGKDFILNKKISYHNGRRKKYSFYEFSVSANLISKYTGLNTALHYSKAEVINQIADAARHTDAIGILFHHRFHGNMMHEIDELLAFTKERYKGSTIMSFIR